MLSLISVDFVLDGNKHEADGVCVWGGNIRLVVFFEKNISKLGLQVKDWQTISSLPRHPKDHKSGNVG